MTSNIRWTPEIIDTIRQQRESGLGYKKIAILLGTTERTIERVVFKHDLPVKAVKEPVNNEYIKIVDAYLAGLFDRRDTPGVPRIAANFAHAAAKKAPTAETAATYKLLARLWEAHSDHCT